MDKKVLSNLVEGMVADIAKEKGIDPGIARGLVVFVLTQNRAAIVNGVNCVNLAPTEVAA